VHQGVVEWAAPEPMLPLRLLRHRIRLGAYLSADLLFDCVAPERGAVTLIVVNDADTLITLSSITDVKIR
jgi:hypothetical protein